MVILADSKDRFSILGTRSGSPKHLKKAQEKVPLLSSHTNGDTQLLNLGAVSFTHVKAAWNECLNLKIKMTFLLKYPVCAINRAIFFTCEWFEILESCSKTRL